MAGGISPRHDRQRAPGPPWQRLVSQTRVTMEFTTYNMQFITPCFCAGANQSIAEVRSPSIRGKLRWWFRVLGGTSAQESEVFGSAAGEHGRSSAVMVRARKKPDVLKWKPIDAKAVSNTGYLLYFAQNSGKGSRWVQTGALPIGSGFEMHVAWLREVPDEAKSRFGLALEAFLLLGSMGLRSSRGLGCFQCAERPFSKDAFQQLLSNIKKDAPAFAGELGAFSGGDGTGWLGSAASRLTVGWLLGWETGSGKIYTARLRGQTAADKRCLYASGAGNAHAIRNSRI